MAVAAGRDGSGGGSGGGGWGLRLGLGVGRNLGWGLGLVGSQGWGGDGAAAHAAAARLRPSTVCFVGASSAPALFGAKYVLRPIAGGHAKPGETLPCATLHAKLLGRLLLVQCFPGCRTSWSGIGAYRSPKLMRPFGADLLCASRLTYARCLGTARSGLRHFVLCMRLWGCRI